MSHPIVSGTGGPIPHGGGGPSSPNRVQELDRQINELAEQEGILTFSRGLLREAPESGKEKIIESTRPFLNLPVGFSDTAVEKFMEDRLQEVRGRLDMCLEEKKKILYSISSLTSQRQTAIMEKAQRHGKTRESLARAARPLTEATLQTTRNECEEYSKHTIQYFIDELQKREQSAPDGTRRTIMKSLAKLRDSIFFRDQKYAKLYQSIKMIRDAVSSVLKDLPDNDLYVLAFDFKKRLDAQKDEYNTAKNTFSVVVDLANIEKMPDLKQKLDKFRSIALQLSAAGDFTGALDLVSSKVMNQDDKDFILVNILFDMAKVGDFTRALDLVPSVVNKTDREFALTYIMLMQFRKKGGLDFVNTKIEKEVERIQQATSELHFVASIEKPGLPSALISLVAYRILKVVGFLSGLLGFWKLKKKCTIGALHHAFDTRNYFLLSKTYKQKVLCLSRNVHKLRTEDLYQSKGLFLPGGICAGMSRHFLYLFLKTKNLFPDERRDIHLQAVTKRFQKGAPRVATLVQGLEGFEIKGRPHDEIATFFPAMCVAQPTEYSDSDSLLEVPSGAYFLSGYSHACAYIKIDQTLSYFFDPNFGTMKFQGENSSAEAAAYFNKVYGKKGTQSSLRLCAVSLPMMTS